MESLFVDSTHVIKSLLIGLKSYSNRVSLLDYKYMSETQVDDKPNRLFLTNSPNVLQCSPNANRISSITSNSNLNTTEKCFFVLPMNWSHYWMKRQTNKWMRKKKGFRYLLISIIIRLYIANVFNRLKSLLFWICAHFILTYCYCLSNT